MGKQRSKILIGVVMSLIFFFMLLSGCKFTSLLKGDPEFKEIRFNCEDKDYSVKIPFDMPDFTQFIYKEFTPITPVIGTMNYYMPDDKTNVWGTKNHYRFIVSLIQEDCPGVLVLALFIDDEMAVWLYDKEGNPNPIALEDAEIWLERWNSEKMSELMEQREQERVPKI